MAETATPNKPVVKKAAEKQTAPADKAEETKVKRETADLEVFEIVAELPKQPTGVGQRGRGPVWMNKLEKVLEQAKPNQWVMVAKYVNGQGATNAKRTFEVASDHKDHKETPDKNSDGNKVTWVFEARRFKDENDLDETGEPKIKSALYVQYQLAS